MADLFQDTLEKYTSVCKPSLGDCYWYLTPDLDIKLYPCFSWTNQESVDRYLSGNFFLSHEEARDARIKLMYYLSCNNSFNPLPEHPYYYLTLDGAHGYTTVKDYDHSIISVKNCYRSQMEADYMWLNIRYQLYNITIDAKLRTSASA